MELLQRRELNKHYVSEIVGQQVKSYTVAEGSKKGDNVIGKMLALTVETESEEMLYVVIKSLLPLTGDITPDVIGSSFFVNGLKVFPTELAYYQQVRPILQKATSYPTSLPKLYSGFTGDGVNDYLALDDLRGQGYKMLDKKIGLGLEEVKLVLKEIALLHAHSYCIITAGNNEDMNKLLQNSVELNQLIWDRDPAGFPQINFFNGIIKKMGEVLRETGDVEKADKLKKFEQAGCQIVKNLFNNTGKTPKYFRCMIHGDLWTNNILFKPEKDGSSSSPEHAVVLIDFQQCRFGNIYEDLQYFIFTSTTADFRKNHLRTCLKFYYEQFCSILESQLGNFPKPSRFSEDQLISTFYENLEYGLCYTVVAIPFQLADPPTEADGPVPSQQETHGEPKPEDLIMAVTEGMKRGVKNTPIALQRLRELTDEMIKLNILT